MKKYISKTGVAITIALPNGGHKRVSFTSQTGGGSVLYVSDPDVIAGLESHAKYGKLFKEVSLPKPKVAKPIDAAAKSDIKQVRAACLDDAKDYLSLHYGVSRTKMRSTKAIKDIAAQNKIEFIGI